MGESLGIHDSDTYTIQIHTITSNHTPPRWALVRNTGVGIELTQRHYDPSKPTHLHPRPAKKKKRANASVPMHQTRPPTNEEQTTRFGPLAAPSPSDGADWKRLTHGHGDLAE